MGHKVVPLGSYPQLGSNMTQVVPLGSYSWRRVFGILGPFWGEYLAAWVFFVSTSDTTWVICSPSTQYDPRGTTWPLFGGFSGASADFGKFKYVQILCFPEGRTRRTTTRPSPQRRGRSQRKGAAVRRRRRLRLIESHLTRLPPLASQGGGRFNRRRLRRRTAAPFLCERPRP